MRKVISITYDNDKDGLGYYIDIASPNHSDDAENIGFYSKKSEAIINAIILAIELKAYVRLREDDLICLNGQG